MVIFMSSPQSGGKGMGTFGSVVVSFCLSSAPYGSLIGCDLL